MVYVEKIMLIFLGLGLAWTGGATWQGAILPEGRAGGLAVFAIVLLMVGAFL